MFLQTFNRPESTSLLALPSVQIMAEDYDELELEKLRVDALKSRPTQHVSGGCGLQVPHT